MSSKAIRDKISALLAKAQGTDNEFEAETFLAKAYELLNKYQLSLEDLIDAEDPIIDGKAYGMEQAKSASEIWLLKLYRALGILYGCESIRCEVYGEIKGKGYNGLKWRQILVGRESAIMTTEVMYPWVVQQVKAKAKLVMAATGLTYQGQQKRIAAALIDRIFSMVAANKSVEAQQPGIVVINKVLVRFEELYPNTKTMKGGANAVTDTLSRKEADSINLSQQMGTKEQLKLT